MPRDAGVPALGYVLEYSALLHALRPPVQGLLVSRRCPRRAAWCTPKARRAEARGKALCAGRAGRAPCAPSRAARRHRVRALHAARARSPCCRWPAATPWSGACAPANAQRRSSACAEADFLARARARPRARVPAGRWRCDARAVQPLALRVQRRRIARTRGLHRQRGADAAPGRRARDSNLGLRDAWDLAQIMREAQDPGDAALLARFAARRRLDAGAAIRVTDLLAQRFVGTIRSRACCAARR